jgi:hypothetical protein
MSRLSPIIAASIAGLTVAGAAQAEFVYGLTATNSLVTFDTATPGVFGPSLGVSGLDAGESLLGIDFRPANNALYALGSGNNLYTIDLDSGFATKVNASPFAVALNGASFGFDFNPTVDRIRVVSDAEQNLRLNPITGGVVDGDAVTPGVQGDGNLAFVGGDPNFGLNPDVVGAGYTNSFAGALSTQLFVLDAANDILALQNPPNAGGLVTVGSLGINISSVTGFDISGQTGVAYMSANGGLYSINLGTGSASFIGAFGTAATITDIAVIPGPGALALLALAGAKSRRRRA